MRAEISFSFVKVLFGAGPALAAMLIFTSLGYAAPSTGAAASAVQATLAPANVEARPALVHYTGRRHSHHVHHHHHHHHHHHVR